jgi:hypothetical protein
MRYAFIWNWIPRLKQRMTETKEQAFKPQSTQSNDVKKEMPYQLK